MKIARGLTYKKADEVPQSSNVVLRANNIDNDTYALDLSDLRYISDDIVIPSSKMVRSGSLLVCTASGSKSHLGKVALVEEDLPYAFGGFMGLLTPTPALNARFLYYALKSDSYRRYIAALTNGTNINNLRPDQIAAFPIPHPPLEEQQRIVALLDAAFEKIDGLKVAGHRTQAESARLTQAYLQKAFEDLTRDWGSAPLASISENLDRVRKPVTKSDRQPGPYPYYGASGVVDYVDSYLLDEEVLLVAEDGANLLSRSSPIAFGASGKIWVNNHAHVLRFPSPIAQRFVETYLNSISIERFVTGTAQPKLTQKAMASIPIPACPVEDQAMIVERMDRVSDTINGLDRVSSERLTHLDQLRQSLLRQAFAGELT